MSGTNRIRAWIERASVYGAELAVGIALAIGFFVVLLAALQWWFPDSTDLGAFARTPKADTTSLSRGPLGAENARPETSDIAILTQLRGDVQDKPADSIAWFVSKMGKRLGNGHAVQSYANASARVTFDDRNSIELGEKTIVVLRAPERTAQAGAREATVLFMDGFLRARIDTRTAQGPALDIVAAGGTIRPVKGGAGPAAELSLRLDRNHSTLAVLDGAAEVRWGGKTTTVASGSMVTYDTSRAPGPAVPLPKTPERVTPRDEASFPFRESPPRIEFSWTPADDAREFHVQIAADAAFARIVYDGRVKEPRFVHGGLDPGRYFWRVAGVRDSIEGRPGAPGRFAVAQEQRPPSLKVELPDVATEPTLMVRGSTDPGCRVFINDVRVTTDAAGRFEQTVTLRQGYNFIVVQAVDPLGNTAFRNHTLVARLARTEEPR